MRKAKLYLLVLTACAMLVACGKDGETSVENSMGNVDSQVEEVNKEEVREESSADYKKDKELPGTLEINLSTVQYCIDTPDTLYSRANTGHIVEKNSYFVVYDQYVDISSETNYGVDYTTIMDAKDIIEEMESQVLANCKNGLIFADEYELDIISEESVKVNSWDMCKTKGVIKLACEWTLDYEQVEYVAYSVIKDGYPVYFAVVEDPLGDNPIDLEEMADRIAKTFRDNPEN